MASTATSLATDPVKQFSVFIENRMGRLSDLTALLQGNNVHLMAIMVLDMTDSAIVRLVVDDPEKTVKLLPEAGFAWKAAEVLALEFGEESELRGVLAALLEAEVNIHYVYSFIKRPHGKSGLVLSVEDAEIAALALHHRGFRVLTQHDISR